MPVSSSFGKEIYFDMKEELEIIKKYQELIFYAFNLMKKYPIEENSLLVYDTKKNLASGLENLIYAKREYYKQNKLRYLIATEAKLNILNVLVRMAIKNRYINKRNYASWSFKITEINDMLRKWSKFCQKV
jgi:hypothetical protein